MASGTLGRNLTFPILKADGTPFNGLVLHKSTVDSVVMSLGDKITGDVYYKDNTLAVTMQEYIEYKRDPSDANEDAVRYVLVSPPTIVREGMVSDNSGLNGMTKYSFTFYHPMYMLGNFPFTDIAVTQDERRYLSQNKTFYWIGTLFEFIDKLNANLTNTEWLVEANIEHYEKDEHGQPTSTETVQWQKASKISDVLSFDKQYVSDALKTGYDTWEIPFTITSIRSGETGYAQGKRFLVTFGLPSQEILDANNQPYVFRFGQGVGLKNNSRTPKNNKIVTRIAGYGAERNVPYGYPQIPWEGDQTWEYTINNSASAQGSYPIYDGIVGGQPVRLIKHPFTRKELMPTVYVETVNKKVNPYATGYDPDTEIIEYYDADNSYPNPVNALAPSFEIHQFEDIYPRLGDAQIVAVLPYDTLKYKDKEYTPITLAAFNTLVLRDANNAKNMNERAALNRLYNAINGVGTEYGDGGNGGSYTFETYAIKQGGIWYMYYVSDNVNYEYGIAETLPQPSWDDSMDDDGNYKQSYFKMTLPVLSFDLYASSAVTEEMEINMRSGNCLGCTFPVQVDWDDYKRNFYDENGRFAPTGSQRDYDKYPDSSAQQITVIVQKDIDTFGALMPNIYQQPVMGDKFVILGISLPLSYISAAEAELADAAKEYMLENNVHYYDYPLKFDEHFLATHTAILLQMQNNSIVRFQYAGVQMALYIKQITIKYGDKVLPEYDITLTDDVEIVLNQIGQVTDDVSRMRVQVSELQKYYSENLIEDINSKLSKLVDDVCQGRITFQQGLTAIGAVVFSGEARSADYETGLYSGRGWRIDNLGNAEMESLRVRSFLEVVELLVNRMQAQEGDTVFSDNDQIDKVEKIVENGTTSYVLSLKEKYQGYITPQMYGNVVKGIINTLAAKQAGVSTYTDAQTVEVDGSNTYYTSWMRVTGTHNTDNTLGTNQIRVVLYGDAQTPAGKNFKPCELMTIARWGCVDYSDPTDPDYETIKASITRRQRMFLISTTEGRVVKYTGVDAPILKNGNYGVTIGELPEFVKNYSQVHAVLERVGEHTDWLYAQGIVVQNFIKITREGLPENNYVDCGEWVDGSQVQNPTPRNGIYYVYEFNETTGQYETHDVWCDGHKWRCLQHQPVTIGGVSTYHKPKWNSVYWRMIEGNANYSLEFESSRGFSFRRGFVDTVITPHLFYGNTDITDDVPVVNWNWTRYEERNVDAQGNITYTEADLAWNAQHTGLITGVKTLHLTNLDMPALWSSSNKAIFACTVTVTNGDETRQIENIIIS